MNLYNSIVRRKSCRKYENQPLAEKVLADMKEAIGSFSALYPEITLEYRLTDEAKGRFKANAPHYLIISGEGQEGELENAGFLYEQLVLWLDALDIGSVWLGSTRGVEADKKGNDIITLAFGSPAEAVHRSLSEFKRKSIKEITNAPDDECIKAAHLAPSGMNLQPWYFEKAKDSVLLYKSKLKPPVSLLYKLADLDLGIALCHYSLACQQLGKKFTFNRTTSLPDKPGYIPFGVIRDE